MTFSAERERDLLRKRFGVLTQDEASITAHIVGDPDSSSKPLTSIPASIKNKRTHWRPGGCRRVLSVPIAENLVRTLFKNQQDSRLRCVDLASALSTHPEPLTVRQCGCAWLRTSVQNTQLRTRKNPQDARRRRSTKTHKQKYSIWAILS